LLQVLPLIYGERHSPRAAASVDNIRPGNVKLEHVIQAICWGIVVNLKNMMPDEVEGINLPNV